MLSFKSAVLLSVLAGSALAAPATSNATDVIGAAYFMTDDMLGNYIVTNKIHSDGTVSFGGQVYAGGIGAHGLSTIIEPDGLFGQGSIQVWGNNLFIVNSATDTVAMFEIDNEDPTKLTMVGQPVDTTWEWPTSIAMNEKTGSLCVLNGGHRNGIQCYTIDKNKGLTKMPNTSRPVGLVNQTTPGTGDPGSSSHILFNHDQTLLHVAVKGYFGNAGFTDPISPGHISTWKVAADGSLSEQRYDSPQPEGGLLPFGMTLVEGTNAFIVADAFIGANVYDFSNGPVANKAVAIFEKEQQMNCWSSYSPSTDHYFLTDFEGSQIFEISIDKQTLNGTTVGIYPLEPNSVPTDTKIVTIDGKDFLYNLAPNVTQLNVMAVESGNSKYIQHFDIGSAMERAEVLYDSNNLQGLAVYLKN